MVHTVRIVPEDAEVLGRRAEPCEPAHRLIRVAVSLRVGILGHTPDALDGFILCDQLFHHIHIRTRLAHRNRNHINAKILGDAEVSVISRHRAEEFHPIQLAPGRIAHDAVCVRSGDRVIHDIQRGIAVYDDVGRIILHHLPHQLLGFLNAVEHAVIAAVCAVRAGQIRITRQNIHHFHGQIQLLPAGLSSCHIEVQFHTLILMIDLFHLLIFRSQFLFRHFRVWFHLSSCRCIAHLRPLCRLPSSCVTAIAKIIPSHDKICIPGWFFSAYFSRFSCSGGRRTGWQSIIICMT